MLWRLMLLSCLLPILSSCGEPATDDSPEPEGGTEHAVPDYEDSKADNYVSTNAREFELSGRAHVTLPEGFADLDDAARSAEVDRLVTRRLSTITRAVRSHIEGVIRTSNGGVTGEDARFFVYFKRNNAAAEPAEVLGDGRARFPFAMELVGSPYLMSQLAPGDSTRRTFEVVAKDWGETEGETVEVRIEGSSSRDAFPRYDELFADGVLDIALHFGGDYNEERFDLDTARWTVEYLLEGGWTHASVTSFDELTIDSGPFERSVQVNGVDVSVLVEVFHSDMVPVDQEQRLREVVEHSLAERDVFIYSGHAGEGAGFVLDYQPRFEVGARELAELPLADKYQIYVLDGCRTYRTYVDDLMRNPRKTFDTVDIVTTVNTTPFAVGYQLIHEFLYWLTLTDGEGRHLPLSWKTILRGLNTERYDDVHYGVHGIDSDPGLNPHASEGIACQPCASDLDCGAGGNMCLGYGAGPGCGVACATDTACPEGYRCARLTDDPDLFYLPKQCVRRDYRCP